MNRVLRIISWPVRWPGVVVSMVMCFLAIDVVMIVMASRAADRPAPDAPPPIQATNETDAS